MLPLNEKKALLCLTKLISPPSGLKYDISFVVVAFSSNTSRFYLTVCIFSCKNHSSHEILAFSTLYDFIELARSLSDSLGLFCMAEMTGHRIKKPLKTCKNYLAFS